MTDKPPKYLSTADIAAVLGVTVMTLCKWRKAGVGPSYARRGYEYHYPASDFADYLERLGGASVADGLTPWQKRKLFSRFHHDNPLADDPSLAELSERLATVESVLRTLSKSMAAVEETLAALARIGLAGVAGVAKSARADRTEAKRKSRLRAKAKIRARLTPPSPST